MARQRGELLTAAAAAAAVVVVVVVGTSVVAAAVAAVTLVEAVLVAAILVEVTSADLAVPVLAEADFAQHRRDSGVPILPVEVWADRPVHSDITTEAAERLLLGHTNSADGETNR